MGSGGIGSPGSGSGSIDGTSFSPSEFGPYVAEWKKKAGEIGSIPPEVEALALTRLEAWTFIGIVDAYNSVVRYVANLTTEGREKLTDIADALQQTADEYQRAETANTNLAKGIGR